MKEHLFSSFETILSLNSQYAWGCCLVVLACAVRIIFWHLEASSSLITPCTWNYSSCHQWYEDSQHHGQGHHDAAPSMLHGGDGVLGVIGSTTFPPYMTTFASAKSSILLSSYHTTRSQNSFPLSRWSLANIKRLLTCFTVRRGVLRGV